MGADRGIHILTDDVIRIDQGLEPFAVASLLQKVRLMVQGIRMDQRRRPILDRSSPYVCVPMYTACPTPANIVYVSSAVNARKSTGTVGW